MLDHDDRHILEGILLPLVSGAGLELFDLVIRHSRGTAHIELLVDYTGGGVSMDDCARLNQKTVSALEEAGIFGDDYTVSVCSPGLDRPLKDARDFQRVAGSRVVIQYRDGEDEDRVRMIEGTIKDVFDHAVVIAQKTGEEAHLLLEYIQQANVQI